ncbi:MAG TPA: hypothetical protein VKR83_01580, partial [Ktedonobacteraceae bacterium]|nr:hypothetical protein [Ktedonobacteraceae bacterium]
SASLELCFGPKKLTLRGIPAIDNVRRVIEYLTPWCQKADLTFHERITRPVVTPLHMLRLEPHTQKRQMWRFANTSKQYTQGITLPVVTVPVSLARGEQAHYSVQATLCGERIQETLRYSYPAQDHGLLILTNRRVIYIGRKCQIVLDYQRLLHVSRLRGAIAFEADHWQKRVIFELPRPEECAYYVEAVQSAIRREVESGILVGGE